MAHPVTYCTNTTAATVTTGVTPVSVPSGQFETALSKINDLKPYNVNTRTIKETPQRLNAVAESIKNGDCYHLIRDENAYIKESQFFHDCENHKTFNAEKNKVYLIEDETASDPYFDTVFFENLQKHLRDLGYECKCDISKRFPPDMEFTSIKLDPKFRAVNY